MNGLANMKNFQFDNGLKGTVRELNVGEYIAIAKHLVGFTDVITSLAEGVSDTKEEKKIFKNLVSDIITVCPQIMAKIDCACTLYDTNNEVDIEVKFSNLPYSVCIDVLMELKEVNASFLGLLQSLMMSVAKEEAVLPD